MPISLINAATSNVILLESIAAEIVKLNTDMNTKKVLWTQMWQLHQT